MLLVAAVNGFGSGILWINQGVWVTKVGKLTGGTMSGEEGLRFFFAFPVFDVFPTVHSFFPLEKHFSHAVLSRILHRTLLHRKFFPPPIPDHDHHIQYITPQLKSTSLHQKPQICNLNGVLGNSLAIFIFLIGLGTDAMIWAMFFIGAFGCGMMAFADPLSDPPTSSSSPLKSTPPSQQKPGTITDAILDMWDVCTMKKSIVLAPTILLQGCNLAFVFGNYPKFVRGGDPIEVAAVFLCFGMPNPCFFPNSSNHPSVEFPLKYPPHKKQV